MLGFVIGANLNQANERGFTAWVLRPNCIVSIIEHIFKITNNQKTRTSETDLQIKTRWFMVWLYIKRGRLSAHSWLDERRRVQRKCNKQTRNKRRLSTTLLVKYWQTKQTSPNKHKNKQTNKLVMAATTLCKTVKWRDRPIVRTIILILRLFIKGNNNMKESAVSKR